MQFTFFRKYCFFCVYMWYDNRKLCGGMKMNLPISVWSGFYYDLAPEKAIDALLAAGFTYTELSEEHGKILLERAKGTLGGAEKVGSEIYKYAQDREFERFAAPAVFTAENFNLMFSKFSSALALWNRQPIDISLKLKSIVYAIISGFFEQSDSPKTVTATDEIIEYIIENLGNASLKVSELCNRFFISESQLRRNFIKATGSKPNEYILALRINKAKNELICTEKTIKQISFECGFSSPYYFSRCFSDVEKETPTAYRKKHSFM